MPAALLVLAVYAATQPNPVVSAAFDRQRQFPQIEFIGRITETVPVPGKPGETWVYEGPLRIVFDVSRTRIEDTRTHTARGGTTRTLEVCDGNTLKEFVGPPGKETRENTNAWVSDSWSRLSGIKDYWLPAFTFARPLGAAGYEMPWLDFTRLNSPDEQVLTGEGAADRLELRLDSPFPLPRPLPEAEGVMLVGTDALPRSLRWAPSRGGVTETKIAYTRHESGVLVPASWEVKATEVKGAPGRAAKVVIEKVTLKREWPADEFDFTFPPGVVVYDRKAGNEYLVREDGTHSPYRHGAEVSPASTPPTTPPASPNWFATYGPLLFCVLLVTGVVIFFVVRRTRRKG